MAAQQVEALLLVLLVAAKLIGSLAADSPTASPQTATESATEEPEAVDPFLEDLCIIENSTEAYRVNTEWTEDACDQKCRCVFRSAPLDDSREVLLLKTINMNSSSELTEIRCSMPPKCGPIENRLHQASRCSRPLLAFSNGEPCSCPRLYCADMPLVSTRPATTTQTSSIMAASSTTTTPVPTTTLARQATVAPSILQPVKSATTTHRPTTTITARPYPLAEPTPVVDSQPTITASVTSPSSGPISTTVTTTTTLKQPTLGPSIFQAIKNISAGAPTTARVPTSSEPPVTESSTTSGPQSTASPTTSTTTTTTSDSSTKSTYDNSIVPAITASTVQQKTEPGCAKKGLDELEANYEECHSSCRCENNKLKCSNPQDTPVVPSQSIDLEPLPWTQQIQSRMNVQKYAWHLLVGFVTMSVMFVIVLFMYMKKSTFVMTSLAAQTGYDNASYNSRLVSYFANQPHVLLLDETNQNFNNAAIIARQKNLEVDQASPLHPQNRRLGEIHHPSGRQHLI